jgi:hypothetical protein
MINGKINVPLRDCAAFLTPYRTAFSENGTNPARGDTGPFWVGSG